MKSNQILLSWIHEYAFCPRRFYLRVQEQNNVSDLAMVEGKIAHNRVDTPKIEKRGKQIQVFRLEVSSNTFGLYGICDRIDFLLDECGVYIPFLKEICTIHPVEFKHGRKRNAYDYNQQLCAQAICLEEMFKTTIQKGRIWYTGTKQSYDVDLSDELRQETFHTINNIRQQLLCCNVIHAKYKKLCPKCALYEICDPKNDAINRYMQKIRETELCIK